MNIDPTATGYPRLAPASGPTHPLQPPRVQPAAPAHRPAAADRTDRLSFEAVYRQQLPKASISEAQRRVERLRDLVGARTNVPIHFQERRGGASTNPYTPTLMRITPDAAALNAAETELAREQSA